MGCFIMTVLLILCLDIGLPLIAFVLFFIFRKEKYLWLVPLIFVISNIIYVLNDILKLNVNEPLNEKIRLYFANDSSMGFYLIHIPMVLFSSVLTVCFMLYKKYAAQKIR
jgi:hypothetical protein